MASCLPAVVLVSSLAALLPLASALAQSYPVKPVRIIVSWPPGGSNDVVARVMAQLRKALDHPESSKILGAQALDPMHMTADEFAARLKSDYSKYERLIRSTGAQAQ